MSPENLRHHAAGHLAAAVLVAGTYPDAARVILADVARFAEHPKVAAPPQLKDKVRHAAEDPAARAAEIAQLEAWFVDPFNTVIENSRGARP